MKINRKSIIYSILAVISILITAITIVILINPSLFYASSSLSLHRELAIRILSGIGSIFSVAIVIASLVNLYEQYIRNETSETVTSDSPAQYSGIIDQDPSYLNADGVDGPPSYSDVIEMDEFSPYSKAPPLYSDAVKMDQLKRDSGTR